jgi:Phage tail tube protein
MSSSSAIQIIAIPEVDYGKTPALATAKANTVRFVSESLSGTPTTTTSAELRTDRMSGGQVVTGLESGGDINFELSKDAVYDAMMASAMMSAWVTGHALPAGSIQITKKPAPDDQVATIKLTGNTADFDGAGRALEKGDILVLSGFTNAQNNVPVQIISVDSATDVTAVVPRNAVDETAAAGIAKLPDYVDIGSLISSYTLAKAYTDVLHLATTEQHSQTYPGSIVNTMALNIAYGEIVTGTFGVLSNGYDQEHPSLAQKLKTAGGTLTPAGTANPLNGSVDMPMVTVNGLPTDYCVQNLSITLDNGATPQTCIGRIAPSRYNLGTASISISMSVYLSDTSYDAFMPAKLSMVPISIAAAALNADGGYAFDLRAVQLTFSDPSASGGDNPVLIDASGTAKVGAGGASAMRIWKW